MSMTVHKVFQSSPFPKEGRYPDERIGAPVIIGFNPHPSRRKGATGAAQLWDRGGLVSILALPEGRALRDTGDPGVGRADVSILALPEGRALRIIKRRFYLKHRV